MLLNSFSKSLQLVSAEESNSKFHNFFESAVLSDSFYANDEYGNDITEQVKMMYDSKGINEVYDYLRSNSGAVGYDEILTAPPTRAVDETKTVYNYQYVLETDTKGRYTKEWQTKLVGTIYMNGNTGLIKRAGTPTIYLTYTNFGASFSPYMSSVSTHSSSTSSYATFSATYHMYATLSISIGDLPLGYTLDFKQHTHSFTSN